jgi:hypothetical protein
MRLPKILFCLALLFVKLNGVAQVKVVNLRCEYLKDPLGVDAPQPVLSWELESKGKNIKQTAYRVIVTDNQPAINKQAGNIWDSKKVNSSASVQIKYSGSQLHAGKKYYWKVMVWDNTGKPSVYSPTAMWQMGLMESKDWSGAKWIAYDVLPDDKKIVPFAHGNGQKEWGERRDVAPLFRKLFIANKKIAEATVFISGLGQFEMQINGVKAGDHFLDPGWTQYSKQAQYVTFDVTKMLNQGNNVIGVMLGNGFYYIPGSRYRKLTGAYGYPKMIAKVQIHYADGSQQVIVSDNSWKTKPSPITFSSVYGGEDYNANLLEKNWGNAAYNDADWSRVKITAGPPQLVAQPADPVRIMQQFVPVSKKELRPAVWVYDLGQNFSGIPQIKVSGKKGDTIILRTAELIHKDGSVNQSATGSPNYYTYILRGDSVETWHPQFSYYGFRYIQVEGAVPAGSKPTMPVIEELKGLHIRNSAREIGTFETSYDLFSKTNQLIRWAIRSNMVSLFTDCPHREKLGWLEETHLMGASVQYNYDIAALSKKVVRDMIDAQTEDGLIPDIAPEYVQFSDGFRDSPEWGSAGVIFPWYSYQWYGDISILKESYPMMKKYVNYLKGKSNDNIVSYGLGDWFDLGPKSPGVSQLTPLGVTATAMYNYDLTIVTKIAAILNLPDDVKHYEQLAATVRKAFNEKYFNEQTKQYATGSQAANAMALYMNLAEPQYRAAVIDNLIKDIQNRGYALTGGDVGYRYILRVLEDAGRSDIIYKMNNHSDVPGYGFQLAKGATSLTESWAALPVVSNNHFMLGHLMEWFYSGLCGIKQAEGSTGFKNIEIRPNPVGDIKDAAASYHSIHGVIAVKWKKGNKVFDMSVTIPVNTTATIYFPAECKKAPVKTGSGVYQFKVGY